MSIEGVLGKVPVNVNVSRTRQTSPLKGFYVNIEGIDGSGKTELVNALTNRMSYLIPGHQGKALTVRQPGGSAYSESIRNICRQAKVDNFTQTLVYGSALYDTYTTVVKPYLEDDGIVIADRGFNTLFAYQGLYGKTSSLIIAMIREIHKYRAPDLTIYLSLPLEESLKRTGANRPGQEDDRYSAQSLQQKRKLKAYYDLLHGVEGEAKEVLTNEEYQWAKIAIHNYLDLDDRIRWNMPRPAPVIIDATQTREQIQKQVYEVISTELEK